MKIPAPRVKVFQWSAQMRFKRRWEVALSDGTDLHADWVPLARFVKEGHACAFAQYVKDALAMADLYANLPPKVAANAVDEWRRVR